MIVGKVIRLLRSLRFTIFLIISLISVFIIGLVVPQKALLGKEIYLNWKETKPALVLFLEALHFTDIYTSPVTLVLWGLFFINLLLIMANRIPSVWRRCVTLNIPGNADSMRKGKYVYVIDGKNLEEIGGVLRKNGYRFFSRDSSFWAVKNRFSPFATILFHLSFLLVLLGSVMAFYTKFRAEAYVAVGETFDGEYQRVRRARIGSIQKTVFRVDEVKPTYYKKDIAVDLKVVLSTATGRKVIGINKPYKEGALSFVVLNIDVAPLFIMKDKKGEEIDSAYVKLIVLGGKEDSFRMRGYEFRTNFFTNISADLDTQTGEVASMPQVTKQFTDTHVRPQQKEIEDPAFHITVVKDGKSLAEKTIRKKQSIEFDGYSLVFDDLVYWVKFYVGKEHGLNIIYTGFFLMTIALIVRFVFYRRDLKGVVEEGELTMSGRGEFYPALFADEFKNIVDELRSPQP